MIQISAIIYRLKEPFGLKLFTQSFWDRQPSVSVCEASWMASCRVPRYLMRGNLLVRHYCVVHAVPALLPD